jgi:hypothetical protein
MQSLGFQAKPDSENVTLVTWPILVETAEETSYRVPERAIRESIASRETYCRNAPSYRWVGMLDAPLSSTESSSAVSMQQPLVFNAIPSVLTGDAAGLLHTQVAWPLLFFNHLCPDVQ